MSWVHKVHKAKNLEQQHTRMLDKLNTQGVLMVQQQSQWLVNAQ